MTSGSTDQTPSERGREAPGRAPRQGEAAQRQGEAGRHEPEQREGFGPLELLRTRKADGRALLLFSHRRTESER